MGVFLQGLRVDKDVVQVGQAPTTQHVTKHIINELLEDPRTIAKSEWHHQGFIVASYEGCLPLITVSDADKIQLGEDGGTRG